MSQFEPPPDAITITFPQPAALLNMNSRESVECTCPFRWTTHYRSCPLYVPDSEVES
jgi:hypothetical protein